MAETTTHPITASPEAKHIEPHEAGTDVSRRDFLLIATGAVAAVGAAATLWPFIDQMNPDASALALASIEVDSRPSSRASRITVKWRGKPVFVRHRTEAEIEAAQDGAARRSAAIRSRATPISTPDAPGDRREPRRRRQGALAGHGRRLHASRLRAARPAGRLRRLVLPLPRLASTTPPAASATARRRRTCAIPPYAFINDTSSGSAEQRDQRHAARTFPRYQPKSAVRALVRRAPADHAAGLRQLRRLSDAAEPELLVDLRRHPGVHAGGADRHRHRARHALRAACRHSPSTRSSTSCAT